MGRNICFEGVYQEIILKLSRLPRLICSTGHFNGLSYLLKPKCKLLLLSGWGRGLRSSVVVPFCYLMYNHKTVKDFCHETWYNYKASPDDVQRTITPYILQNNVLW